MSPHLRTLLVGLLASLVGVWVGTSVAQEEYFIAALSAGICLWGVLAWTTTPRAEAWLLALVLVGYVLGNRGFAQLTPIPGLPLFFSELGLGFIITLMILRSALQRQIPFQLDWLNRLLLAWLVVGSGRIVWDMRIHGLLAMRDFAMVYYVLYFFGTQALVPHGPSRQLIKRTLMVAFGLLPISGLLASVFPAYLQSHFLINGVPLILYKGDLLASFLFIGFILLLPTTPFNYRTDLLRWALALGALAQGLTLLSRSSLLGLLVAAGWLAYAGRWRTLRVIGGSCVVGLLLVSFYSILQKKDFTQTQVYSIYEAATSIVDINNSHRYKNELSGNKGDNNQFRLVWWKNVIEETLTKSPILGMGFGADLTQEFLREYYPTGEPDFTARSPHNIFVTTFGRMGLLGVAGLLAIYWAQARQTARTARLTRNRADLDELITQQAAIWVILVSACLGVVLEGPMGAIPFWIMLGLTHYSATKEP